MTEKRFTIDYDLTVGVWCLHDAHIKGVDGYILYDDEKRVKEVCDLLNSLNEENEQLKSELKRCKEWLNSDKYDYQTTLAFIKSKGYSLKDVLEYEKNR